MDSPIAPDWSGAIWIGAVDVASLEGVHGDTVVLGDSTGYRRARLLIRRGRAVLGFVELPVVDLPQIGGSVSFDDLVSKIAKLGPVAGSIDPIHLPTVTVIVSTRDRADQLRGALTSVLALDYPAFDVIVVDNAPATDATRVLVETEFADPRVRLIREPVAGLSRARNTGLIASTGEFVAFTDDDVVVDSHWLRALVAGFARGADVDCVTGLVPSGELRTPVQRFFDDRVSWSGNLVPREFRLSAPPADLPMFPFSVGEFGTGANFALRRTRAIELGGFDTAFGVGTRTGGGEDLDIFTRVLFAGSALVVEPSALVWHRHRADLGALRSQAVGYGTGLGAWLTKVALDPTMMKVAVRRAPSALRRLAAKGGGTLESGEPVSDDAARLGVTAAPAEGGTDWAKAVSKVGWTELVSVAKGPGRYLRQRWNGTGLIDPQIRTAALARR
ncbi:glycosyltransferase family 2 protein [Frondihabitans sp. PhB188]|uniref:glycosyltransferase family 2 protein n=1 Tax=Frondihabitans sp. PhB188 TaxID=2485200 RepID=UPI00131562E4|nr:glycosyltransferase [Frondihabitans sp. PhB188]